MSTDLYRRPAMPARFYSVGTEVVLTTDAEALRRSALPEEFAGVRARIQKVNPHAEYDQREYVCEVDFFCTGDPGWVVSAECVRPVEPPERGYL